MQPAANKHIPNQNPVERQGKAGVAELKKTSPRTDIFRTERCFQYRIVFLNLSTVGRGDYNGEHPASEVGNERESFTTQHGVRPPGERQARSDPQPGRRSERPRGSTSSSPGMPSGSCT